MLGTLDGWLLTVATVVGATITAVGTVAAVVYSARKTRRTLGGQLGDPNGGGSVVGEVAIVQRQLDQFKGEVKFRLDRGEQRFDRLDRGHTEIRDSFDQMTHGLAQLTSQVAELNALHRTEEA